MVRAVALLALACAAAALAPPRGASSRLASRRFLFGGGKKDGGALSNVAGVMDQFKKAQEIAKKSQEMQQELAAAEFEGANADGTVTFKMNGQQQPVSAAAPGFDGEAAPPLDPAPLRAQLARLALAGQRVEMEVVETSFDECRLCAAAYAAAKCDASSLAPSLARTLARTLEPESLPRSARPSLDGELAALAALAPAPSRSRGS